MLTIKPPYASRSPHGERGLKYRDTKGVTVITTSLPAWGAWIEIRVAFNALQGQQGRSPHGERGLKYPDLERNENR